MPQFSAEQLAAIDLTRLGTDACVVAGPGSGKTTVLVERYRQLVESGIDPQHILAITFTEKAANNLKVRLGKSAGLEKQLGNAYVSTVHGFCSRLIRENAVRAGVDPGVSILQEAQSAILQRRSLTDALDKTLEEQPEQMLRLMQSLGDPKLDLLGVYDAIRSAGVSISELRKQATPFSVASLEKIHSLIEDVRGGVYKTPLQRTKLTTLLEWGERLQSCQNNVVFLQLCNEFKINLNGASDAFKEAVRAIQEQIKFLQSAAITNYYWQESETLFDVLERFDELYTKRKRERGGLDFSDLEYYTVLLLQKHSDLRARLRQHFRQILMDEFQDTNRQQSRLLELLRAPGAFFAVGDINQSIFSFRHADPDVFREYRDKIRNEGKHHTELVENWRSRPEILLATETLLEGAEGIEPRPLVGASSRSPKAEPSVEVIAFHLEKDNDVDKDQLEAQWIAQRMTELRGTLTLGEAERRRKADWGDMAVLARNSSIFDALAQEFKSRRIPYELSKQKGWLETREALDLIHLLRSVANPRDEVSLAAVLRSPFVRISDEALFRLKLHCDDLSEALDHLSEIPLLAPEDREKLQHFHQHFQAWRELQPSIGLDLLLLRAMDQSNYPWNPYSEAGVNIEQFLKLARLSDATLEEFLEELEILRDSRRSQPEGSEDRTNAVRILTAHSSKGLEFPIVFVASLHKGVNTLAGSFSFTPEFGLGARWLNPANGESADDSVHSANNALKAEREKQEGDRLFYVALTRAEEHLVLSYAKTRQRSDWAKRVETMLGTLESVPDGEPEEVTVEAPNGRPFSVRVITAVHPPQHLQRIFSVEQKQEITVLPRPELHDQAETAVNVTAVSLFAKDPEQYYRERYLGWSQKRTKRLADWEEDPVEEESYLSASELGTQVHALLSGEILEEIDPVTLRLADRFRRSELGQRAERALSVEREFSFLVDIAGVLVRGQIDLWFEEGGELILIDYKTDDLPAAQAEAKAQQYAMQIHLYAWTLRKITGRLPDHAYIHFLRCDQLVPIVPNPELAEATVLRLAAAHDSGRFVA